MKTNQTANAVSRLKQILVFGSRGSFKLSKCTFKILGKVHVYVNLFKVIRRTFIIIKFSQSIDKIVVISNSLNKFLPYPRVKLSQESVTVMSTQIDSLQEKQTHQGYKKYILITKLNALRH